MKFKGRLFRILIIIGLVVLCFGLLVSDLGARESYPTRSITLILGYSAGGATDLTIRVLSDAAAKVLGQPIAVINKPGGSSSVALSYLMTQTADGYTIGIMPSGGIFASFLTDVPYDPVKDFTPIMQYGLYQDGFAVLADSPWKTFKEFLDYAKQNPGKIRFASAGVGTPERIVMERLSKLLDIKWLHVPYNGDKPAATALLGGHVDAVATSSGGWKPYVDSGKFRLLTTFHQKRMAAYPDVPTVSELGYDLVAASLISIVGPKGLSDNVVATLHDAFKKAMDDKAFIETMTRLGVGIRYRGPEDLGQFIQRIVDENRVMIEKLGLKK